MSYIKAYSDENLRHPDLFQLRCPDEKIPEVLVKLAEHFGIPPVTVTWKGRNGRAFYNPHGHVINFTPKFTKNSWLLVCHEFAHALTDIERDKRCKELQKVIDRARVKRDASAVGLAVYEASEAQIRLLSARREKIRRLKAHSGDFSENVTRVCDYVRAQKWTDGSEKIEGEPLKSRSVAKTSVSLAPPAFDLVKTAFDSYPAELRCNACWKFLPKEEIGMRVMSRSTDGRPTHVTRQSHCKACRSKKR